MELTLGWSGFELGEYCAGCFLTAVDCCFHGGQAGVIAGVETTAMALSGTDGTECAGCGEGHGGRPVLVGDDLQAALLQVVS